MPNASWRMMRSCDSDLRILEFAPLAQAGISVLCSTARLEGPAVPSFPPAVVVNRRITWETRLGGRVFSETW